MKHIKIASFDIDGTLIDINKKNDDKENRRNINSIKTK